jgi:dCMP deaminase
MINKELKKHVTYLKMASEWSENSCCNRKKVGALIIKDQMIVSDGYNGTPSGFNNDCEGANGDTQWYVLHAEANAITKLAKNASGNSEGSTLYVTLSPCKECCKLIIQTGIKRVFFKELYRDQEGLRILRESGILIEQLQY